VVQEGGDLSSRAAVIFAVDFKDMARGFAWLFLKDDTSAWPVLLLPAGGLAVVVVVFRARARKRKFGVSVIECRSMPARPGERFQGTVETGVPLRGRPSLEFRVRLRCLRRRTRLERVNGETKERVTVEELWKHEEQVRGLISSKGPTFQLPLDLAIPEGLPGTELLPEDDRTLWQVAVHAPDPGVDYDAVFELPVYARKAAAATG
jgi:hypothetical protein